MRKFQYRHNGGAEYSISVLSDSNQLLVAAYFPTPAAVKDFYQRDINMYLAEKTLPELTAEELEVCKKLIEDNQ